MDSVTKKLYEAELKGYVVAVCTVVDKKGAAPASPGGKMIVYTNGSIYGTVGGGALEKKVIENALYVLKSKKPQLFRHDLLHQHSMCCGGSLQIFIEPILRKNRLYIFGAGHIGKALAQMAVNFDFEIFVIDNRPQFINEITVKGINKMPMSYEMAVEAIPFDDQTYVCVMTHDHALDRQILGNCIHKPFAYLGMIGSRRKVEVTKKIFLESGSCTADELDKIDMPMGININAVTPVEIAVSILAGILKLKNLITQSDHG